MFKIGSRLVLAIPILKHLDETELRTLVDFEGPLRSINEVLLCQNQSSKCRST